MILLAKSVSMSGQGKMGLWMANVRPRPADAINDSDGKFCADNRMGKKEQAAKMSPRPAPRTR